MSINRTESRLAPVRTIIPSDSVHTTMDESLLETRLSRIEQRQYLIILLLVIPYFIGLAELIGYPTTGVLATALAVVVFVVIAVSRRRNRSATEQ